MPLRKRLQDLRPALPIIVPSMAKSTILSAPFSVIRRWSTKLTLNIYRCRHEVCMAVGSENKFL